MHVEKLAKNITKKLYSQQFAKYLDDITTETNIDV